MQNFSFLQDKFRMSAQMKFVRRAAKYKR